MAPFPYWKAFDTNSEAINLDEFNDGECGIESSRNSRANRAHSRVRGSSRVKLDPVTTAGPATFTALARGVLLGNLTFGLTHGRLFRRATTRPLG